MPDGQGFDLAVIGAGSAGLSITYVAARLGRQALDVGRRTDQPDLLGAPPREAHRVGHRRGAAEAHRELELRAALGPDKVRDGASELSLYRKDASGMEGAAAAVCFAATTEDVRLCVETAVRHGVPFVARGSGTGLAGGAVPPDGAQPGRRTGMIR